MCPDGCTPVDVPPAFGHVAPCDLCPHVRCAVCGAWAEPVSPAELAEAWAAMLASRPVAGQVGWINMLAGVIPGGGCPTTTEVIGCTYECQLTADHKGRHRVGSASWR